MKEYYWCRVLLDNNEYYYIYVVKEAAIEIYEKEGFEIKNGTTEYRRGE